MDRNAAMILGICIVLAAAILAIGGMPRRSGGRYQMVPSKGVNMFVIDTQTGRVWSKLIPSSEGRANWTREPTPWNQD